MEWLLLIGIVVGLLLITAKQNKKVESDHQYQLCKQLITEGELKFLNHLNNIASTKYEILSKVRIADVIEPRKNTNSKNWYRTFNRISSKHFDFVLCEKNTYKVCAAIELDDKSHNTKKAKERDSIVNQAVESAGLKLLRFKAKSRYSDAEINEVLVNHGLGGKVTPPSPLPRVL